MRRAVSKSAYQSNSDVRQRRAQCFPNRHTFRIWGVSVMNKTRSLSRLSLRLPQSQMPQISRAAVAARRHLDGMLHRRKCRLRPSDGRFLTTLHPHLPTSTPMDSSRPNIHPGFRQQGIPGRSAAGCQQQIGMFLWGAEGDWSSFNNGNSHVFSSGFDEGGGVTFSQTFNQSLSYTSLWSVRGRFGGHSFRCLSSLCNGRRRRRYGEIRLYGVDQRDDRVAVVRAI